MNESNLSNSKEAIQCMGLREKIIFVTNYMVFKHSGWLGWIVGVLSDISWNFDNLMLKIHKKDNK